MSKLDHYRKSKAFDRLVTQAAAHRNGWLPEWMNAVYDSAGDDFANSDLSERAYDIALSLEINGAVPHRKKSTRRVKVP